MSKQPIINEASTSLLWLRHRFLLLPLITFDFPISGVNILSPGVVSSIPISTPENFHSRAFTSPSIFNLRHSSFSPLTIPTRPLPTRSVDRASFRLPAPFFPTYRRCCSPKSVNYLSALIFSTTLFSVLFSSAWRHYRHLAIFDAVFSQHLLTNQLNNQSA